MFKNLSKCSFGIVDLYSKLKSCSMAGKQVYEVPSDNVGGSSSCIAVCNRGTDIQKVNGVCFPQFLSYLMTLLSV